MTVALVTGASGFIGTNLVEALQRRDGLKVHCLGHARSVAEWADCLQEADVVYHLAGVNRPESESDYETGNAQFTRLLCDQLRQLGRHPKVVLSSSVQALQDNPYGRSKKRAEEEVCRLASETGATAIVFRLKNVFGKWCRPNYNSVVATLCHNTARELPTSISDVANEVTFIYIDDVIDGLLAILDEPQAMGDCRYQEIKPSYTITLGALAERIRVFRDMRRSLVLPDFSDRFTRSLYATYLSYLEKQDFAYDLEPKADARGELAEFIKSHQFGQIFVSRTKPGVVRGNHYHYTKTEKFLVLEGQAVVRFRDIRNENVVEYPVSGGDFRVVDIPPGYTHSIQNVGESELVVLFWASEIFDAVNPDTYYSEVQRN